MKTKVKFHLKCYGIIDSITDGIINARIYNSCTDELTDIIEFPSTNFNESERRKLIPSIVFTWSVGYIGKKPFSSFRLKRPKNKHTTVISQQEMDELMSIFNS